MRPRSWVAVVNQSAGASPTDIDALRSAAAGYDLDVAFTHTANSEDADRCIVESLAAGCRDFLAIGGDGTAHGVVNTLMQSGQASDCTFGIVATGSGSDFGRTFGRGRDPLLDLERLIEPSPLRLDVGRIKGDFGTRYFLNALNVGVAAASAHTAARLPRRLGSSRYPTGFWLALARFPPATVEVVTGRHVYRGEALTVVVANGQFFGGGMNIAPKASAADGLFDVQVFEGPRRRAFSVMPRVMRGTHLTHTAVHRYVGPSVTITAPHDWPVEADGEILGKGAVSVTVEHEAIAFVP